MQLPANNAYKNGQEEFGDEVLVPLNLPGYPHHCHKDFLLDVIILCICILTSPPSPSPPVLLLCFLIIFYTQLLYLDAFSMPETECIRMFHAFPIP